jgi:hypothetical protein
MPEAWILNKMLMFALGFFVALKLVNITLVVKVMRGSRGLFGLALMGFLFKLNVLKIIGEGA